MKKLLATTTLASLLLFSCKVDTDSLKNDPRIMKLIDASKKELSKIDPTCNLEIKSFSGTIKDTIGCGDWFKEELDFLTEGANNNGYWGAAHVEYKKVLEFLEKENDAITPEKIQTFKDDFRKLKLKYSGKSKKELLALVSKVEQEAAKSGKFVDGCELNLATQTSCKDYFSKVKFFESYNPVEGTLKKAQSINSFLSSSSAINTSNVTEWYNNTYKSLE